VRELVPHVESPRGQGADALDARAESAGILTLGQAASVLTRHPGEMSGLRGTSIDEIQSNRVAAALDGARRWGAVVVLKGARTVIALPDGTAWINATGNPGMSTGGSGDVLTGTIAGLLGQRLSPEDAAVCGVYLHGLAGEIAAERIAPIGYFPTELQDLLPAARARIQPRPYGQRGL